MTTANELISLLGLEPHPEGGFYRQTFADRTDAAGRPVSTLIYYLLMDSRRNSWHRVDSAEVWHFYAGSPVMLRISHNGRDVIEHRLGTDFRAGERPQFVIQPGAWQCAEVLGDFCLVGCSVAPGFQFSKFEQAPPGWEPG